MAALLERVSAQLAMEVVLPELGKPDVAPVVVQRAAGEVAVKAWQGTRRSGPRALPALPHLTPALRASRGLREGPGKGREEGVHPPMRGSARKNKMWSVYIIQNEKSCIKSQGEHV